MSQQQEFVSARTMASSMVWIVVVTKPSQERRALRELEQQFVRAEPYASQGYEIYLPMKLGENRRRETIASPFFPRYLFARVSLDVNGWKRIFGTYGVSGVLGPSERPIGVRDSVIERIKAQEDAGFIRMGLESGFKHGDRISLDDLGLEAVFLERVDERRAMILVKLLGQDHRLTVDLGRIRSSQAE